MKFTSHVIDINHATSQALHEAFRADDRGNKLRLVTLKSRLEAVANLTAEALAAVETDLRKVGADQGYKKGA